MKYTNQSAFTKVVTELLKQNKVSVECSSSNRLVAPCMLRGHNNTKCAIGHLIPDSFYDPRMEYLVTNIEHLCYEFPKIKELLGEVDETLLAQLRECHDNLEPVEWRKKLKKIGSKFNLIWPKGI